MAAAVRTFSIFAALLVLGLLSEDVAPPEPSGHLRALASAAETRAPPRGTALWRRL